MKDLKKYEGIFPAFYACYDEAGAVSPERTRALTEYLIGKGVTGLYVGGSSGECIYQSVAERKLLLENVMAVAKGRIVITLFSSHIQRIQEVFSLAEHYGRTVVISGRSLANNIEMARNIGLIQILGNHTDGLH